MSYHPQSLQEQRPGPPAVAERPAGERQGYRVILIRDGRFLPVEPPTPGKDRPNDCR